MKDEQYNDYIKQQLKNSEEKHFSKIEHNQKDVWNRIDERLEKKKVIPLWIYSTAASIILLLSITFLFNKQVNKRNIEIAKLQTLVEIQNKQLNKLENNDIQVVKVVDTVKIVQEKLVYVPVKSIDTLVLRDTINQLVKLVDTVFINKPEENILAANNSNTNLNSKSKESTPNISTKKTRKKKRSLVFLIGNQRNKSAKSETNHLVSLRTN